MRYTIQYGDTLLNIAKKTCGSKLNWEKIAKKNHLTSSKQLFVGQKLNIPSNCSALPSIDSSTRNHSLPSFTNQKIIQTPAVSHVFIIADELNPFTKKLVRKVIVPTDLQHNPELLKRIINPDKYGFFPRDPSTNVSLGRHVKGMTNSRFISTSERLFGASRFEGKRYWIDVNKLLKSGAKIYSSEEIVQDLKRIAKKLKNKPKELKKIEGIIHLSTVEDRELVVEGDIPASAVKGALAMGATRTMQFVQIIGIIITARDLEKATEKSIKVHSIKPLVKESVKQAGGWGGFWAGARIGAMGGAALGIETGPFDWVPAGLGFIGGGIGGYFGYHGPEWIQKYLHHEKKK